MMQLGLPHLQADDGGSVYLRLTTRVIDQVERTDDGWRRTRSPAAIG